MKRRMLVLLVTVVIGVMVASPAFAAAPEQWTWSWTQAGRYVGSCGTFNILADVDLTTTVTNFQQAQLVRASLHTTANAVFYPDGWVSNLPAEPVQGWGSWTYQFEWPSGSGFWMSGLQYHIVVPGVGSALIDAGQIFWDWPSPRFAGNHQVTFGDIDVTKLCSLFQ